MVIINTGDSGRPASLVTGPVPENPDKEDRNDFFFNKKLLLELMRLLKLPAALILLMGTVLPTGGLGVSETIPGPIPATVLRIIDGDTIVVRARI